MINWELLEGVGALALIIFMIAVIVFLALMIPCIDGSLDMYEEYE